MDHKSWRRLQERQLTVTIGRKTQYEQRQGDILAFEANELAPWWKVWLPSDKPTAPWYRRLFAPRYIIVDRVGFVRKVTPTHIELDLID